MVRVQWEAVPREYSQQLPVNPQSASFHGQLGPLADDYGMPPPLSLEGCGGGDVSWQPAGGEQRFDGGGVQGPEQPPVELQLLGSVWQQPAAAAGSTGRSSCVSSGPPPLPISPAPPLPSSTHLESIDEEPLEARLLRSRWTDDAASAPWRPAAPASATQPAFGPQPRPAMAAAAAAGRAIVGGGGDISGWSTGGPGGRGPLLNAEDSSRSYLSQQRAAGDGLPGMDVYSSAVTSGAFGAAPGGRPAAPCQQSRLQLQPLDAPAESLRSQQLHAAWPQQAAAAAAPPPLPRAAGLWPCRPGQMAALQVAADKPAPAPAPEAVQPATSAPHEAAEPAAEPSKGAACSAKSAVGPQQTAAAHEVDEEAKASSQPASPAPKHVHAPGSSASGSTGAAGAPADSPSLAALLRAAYAAVDGAAAGGGSGAAASALLVADAGPSGAAAGCLPCTEGPSLGSVGAAGSPALSGGIAGSGSGAAVGGASRLLATDTGPPNSAVADCGPCTEDPRGAAAPTVCGRPKRIPGGVPSDVRFGFSLLPLDLRSFSKRVDSVS